MKKYLITILITGVLCQVGKSQSINIGPEGSEVFAFEVTGDREHAILAFDGSIGLLNLRENQLVAQYHLERITNVNTLELAPDSSRLFYGTTSGKLAQITLTQKSHDVLIEGQSSITCIKAMTQERILVGYKNGDLMIWDSQQQKAIRQLELSKTIMSIAYDPEMNEAIILTIDGKVRAMDQKGEFRLLIDLKKPALDLAYNSQQKMLHVGTNTALFSFENTNGIWNQITRRKNNQWNVCTTDSDQLKSPAVAYMNGLIKVYSPYAIFKYKLSTAPLAIEYALAGGTNINMLVLGMDRKLYFIRSSNWKMKT